MANGNKNQDLLDIPFDQFSRQLIVKNIINDILRTSKTRNKFKILDVGGYKGKTKEFLLDDDVTVLDVFDVHEPKYIKGDATKINAADDAYDIVCSFDVLEHIPKSKREAFVQESARVSKIGFFMTAPVDDVDNLVSSAESAANEVFSIVNSVEHKWLKEHIEYGIPTSVEIERLLRKNNLYFTVVKNNELTKWFVIQSTFFIKSILEKDDTFLENKYLPQFHELHKLIDTTYNNNYESLEVHGDDVAYSSVYFVSKHENDVKKVNDYLVKISTKHSINELAKAQITVYETAFKSIAEVVKIMQTEGDQLKAKLVVSDELLLKAGMLKVELAHKERLIQEIQHSTSWKITKPLRQIGVFTRSIRKKGKR